jgi:hypothetical protein
MLWKSGNSVREVGKFHGIQPRKQAKQVSGPYTQAAWDGYDKGCLDTELF